jgi:hypothetical protein
VQVACHPCSCVMAVQATKAPEVRLREVLQGQPPALTPAQVPGLADVVVRTDGQVAHCLKWGDEWGWRLCLL